jgi:hypothetical protein
MSLNYPLAGQAAHASLAPSSPSVPKVSPWRLPSAAPEHVKAGETVSYLDLMSASGVGWLIQATVGNFGGVGRWCRNRAGLAA